MPMRISKPLAIAALAAAAMPAAAEAARNDVTVMSRNLYLGTDLIPAATAPNLEELKNRVSQAKRNVDQTNFPVRAQALAREVQRKKPDLIGLQEVTQYRTGPQDGGLNATTELYDWMDTLQAELRERGQRYRIVVRRMVEDIEIPSAENTDLRLTIGDAILVRRGSRVRVGNPRTGGYDETLKLTLANGAAAEFGRGWQSVDARVAGRRFRFVNTHLEAFGDEIRLAQAQQLTREAFGSRSRPAILVGDLNSDPSAGDPDSQAFAAIRAAGFRSVFPREIPTSGFNELVNDPSASVLERTIDHIMVRPRLKRIRADVVGDTTAEKVGGLWPSDHAGVVATIRIPRNR